MPVRTKRWNDPAEPEDGYRLLVCRYRPRGVPKEGEPWDAWCPALAPSEELHADAYGKNGEVIAWETGYVPRFVDEMKRSRYWLESFAARVTKGETLTLLCSSACIDPARCHRTLVKEMIEALAFPPSAPAKTGVVRRKRP